MKARVKATGEIIEVIAIGDYINENGQIIGEYKDANGMPYNSYDLDFYIEEGITIPDYWTRLEHQYAGMAMQGLSEKFFKKYRESCAMYAELDDEETVSLLKVHADAMADVCYYFAHALVEKLKSENNGK